MYSDELESLKLILKEQIQCGKSCLKRLSVLKISLQAHDETAVYQELDAFNQDSNLMKELEEKREQCYRKCLAQFNLGASSHFYDFVEAVGDSDGQLMKLYKTLKEVVIKIQSSNWMLDSYLKATKSFIEQIVNNEMEQRSLLTYGKSGFESFSGDQTSFLLNINV